jgi:hypothetical protein
MFETLFSLKMNRLAEIMPKTTNVKFGGVCPFETDNW